MPFFLSWKTIMEAIGVLAKEAVLITLEKRDDTTFIKKEKEKRDDTTKIKPTTVKHQQNKPAKPQQSKPRS